MQSVSYRIWTRVPVSISYDDNHYTTDTSSVSTYQHLLFHSTLFISNFYKISPYGIFLSLFIENLFLFLGVLSVAINSHLVHNILYLTSWVSILLIFFYSWSLDFIIIFLFVLDMKYSYLIQINLNSPIWSIDGILITLQFTVDLGVIAIKGYFKLSTTPW